MSRVTEVTVALEPVSNKVGVVSPFSGDFIAKARAMGGKWVDKRWVFPGSMEAQVRALCIEIYGTDGGAPKPTREGLETRLAQHLAAIVDIQAQLDALDAEAGVAP